MGLSRASPTALCCPMGKRLAVPISFVPFPLLLDATMRRGDGLWHWKCLALDCGEIYEFLLHRMYDVAFLSIIEQLIEPMAELDVTFGALFDW